jgi:hypothetical protein
MEIHNLLAGYIKVNLLGRSFAVQLPHKVLSVKAIKSIDEDGNMTAICTMDNGCDYVRYIDLSEMLALLGVDRIAFTRVVLVM